MKTSLLAAMVFLTSLFSTTISADGTHGVKVTVVNQTGKKIEILTYNSKDSSMSVPHKVYYADAGGTRVVKGHGQGTDKIRITIQHAGKYSTQCRSSGGKLIKANHDKWKDGTTLTVASCYSTYDEGF